jgi:hypothetical protein
MFGRCLIQISAATQAVLIDVFFYFAKSQCQDYNLIRPRPLSTKSFPIHLSSYHPTFYSLNNDGASLNNWRRKSIEVPYCCVPSRECRIFSCQLCSNTYLSWGNLVAHRKACHRGQVLSCVACGQRKFHPGLGPVNFPVGGSPIGCEECGEGFSTVMQLYRHYRVHVTHQFMPHKGELTKVLCVLYLLHVCPSLCNNSDVTT